MYGKYLPTKWYYIGKIIYNMLTNILTKNNKYGGMKLFELESTANLQTSHSRSLRTTIPVEIVKALDLKDKDKILWTISAENNEIIIRLKKKE